MFTVSTQVRYSLRALARIAMNQKSGYHSIASIAAKEKLSVKYLENIFKQLKKGGIVESSRGPEGGYRLAKDPGEINIREIVTALEGPIATVACVADGPVCERSDICTVKPLWSEMQDHIITFLEGKTLSTVIESESISQEGGSHG